MPFTPRWMGNVQSWRAGSVPRGAVCAAAIRAIVWLRFSNARLPVECEVAHRQPDDYRPTQIICRLFRWFVSKPILSKMVPSALIVSILPGMCSSRLGSPECEIMSSREASRQQRSSAQYRTRPIP